MSIVTTTHWPPKTWETIDFATLYFQQLPESLLDRQLKMLRKKKSKNATTLYNDVILLYLLPAYNPPLKKSRIIRYISDWKGIEL